MVDGRPEGGWWETVGALRERLIELEQAVKAHTMLHARDEQYDTGTHSALAVRVSKTEENLRHLSDEFLTFRGEIKGTLQGFRWMAGGVTFLVTLMTGVTVAVQLGWMGG